MGFGPTITLLFFRYERMIAMRCMGDIKDRNRLGKIVAICKKHGLDYDKKIYWWKAFINDGDEETMIMRMHRCATEIVSSVDKVAADWTSFNTVRVAKSKQKDLSSAGGT